MAEFKAYITRRLPQAAVDIVKSFCETVIYDDDLPPPKEEILRNMGDKDAILPLLTDAIDGEVMDAAPKLKVVAHMAVGYDNVDVKEATKRGILVTNTPGVLTETTADLTWALLMAAARRIVEADAYARAGKWKTWGPTVLCGQDVYGATIGIVGMGRIGAAVARRAKGFGMRILYSNLNRNEGLEKETGAEWRDFESLMRESDFVTVHVPLTKDTEKVINEKSLSLMKPTAILVNTSRGRTVDQAALYRALKEKRIAAAGIDVFEVEPVDPAEPLLTLDNVVAAPHIGSASVATRTKMAVMAAQNLVAALKGERPPNLVNAEAWRG